MKYLFFDVECSNCFEGVGKICEFGYVLTDEQFNIIRQDDIPMSPGRGERNRFHLKGRKDERDLELAYEYDYYYSCPEFPKFYNQIKTLMEDKDTICFAYSMDNDIRHLANTCKRYHLEPLNYICYDIQILAKRYLELTNSISLQSACLKIVGSGPLVGLQEHLSRDDAKMEMMIFEAVCVLSQKSSINLLKEPEFVKVNSIEFLETIKKRTKCKQFKKKGHDLFLSLCITKEDNTNPEYIGRRYNCSGELKAHYNELTTVIDYVKKHNGVLCNSVPNTDVFVMYDDANKDEVIQKLHSPFEGKMVTFNELINGGK